MAQLPIEMHLDLLRRLAEPEAYALVGVEPGVAAVFRPHGHSDRKTWTGSRLEVVSILAHGVAKLRDPLESRAVVVITDDGRTVLRALLSRLTEIDALKDRIEELEEENRRLKNALVRGNPELIG